MKSSLGGLPNICLNPFVFFSPSFCRSCVYPHTKIYFRRLGR